MKNWIIVLLIFILPLGLYAYLENRAAANYCKATGGATAVSTKARMVKFSSPMCSECNEIAVEIEKAMAKFKDDIVVEEYNVLDSYKKGKNAAKDAIKKYKVTLVPTIIFIDKEGNTVRKQEGMMPSNEIIRILDEIK